MNLWFETPQDKLTRAMGFRFFRNPIAFRIEYHQTDFHKRKRSPYEACLSH